MRVKLKTPVVIALLTVGTLLLSAAPAPQTAEQNWTHYVRIGAYGLKGGDADEIVRKATASNVAGIEVDNDIPGRYESFVDPTAKLKAIHDVAEAAHKAGNHSYVYIAGTECITANADQTPHTLAKEHPDWLQRKLTGEPAIFGGGTAFWIRKGDEDVWVSPYATEWRKIYMQRVRQIAETGIDGIYIDIPYWMTHFDGWEDSWASFDDFTVAEFEKQTGLDAKKDVKIGNFEDPGFRKWVDFRIQTFTDFLHEIDTNAKSVNPQIKTIPEIYPGIEEEAPRVGADVYALYPVVDVIAHEYEFGSTGHLASERQPYQWFAYQVGMHSFRAFAEGKATWILNYSWDGSKTIAPPEPMKNLAMSQIMDGANFWDAPGHSMGGSNDLKVRKQIFDWIQAHEKTFYLPRSPIDPIGVYFSPETRNYYAKDFIASYRGVLILLMQKHLEFQIVTPRTLAAFQGKTLVLPDARILTDGEKAALKSLSGAGKKLVINGADATQLGDSANVVRFPEDPGKAYADLLEKGFDAASPGSQEKFLSALAGSEAVKVKAGPHVATSISRTTDGRINVFFANFTGLVGGKNAVQTPLTDVEVTVKSEKPVKAFFLPFMGEAQPVAGVRGEGSTKFKLPTITRGAVFWYEP